MIAVRSLRCILFEVGKGSPICRPASLDGPKTAKGKIWVVDEEPRELIDEEERKRAERDYYRSLTPEERISIMLEMMHKAYGPPKKMEMVFKIMNMKDSE